MRGGKREGAGRPAKYEDAVVVHIRMPRDLVEALDKLAEKLEIPRAEVVVARLSKDRAVAALMKKGGSR